MHTEARIDRYLSEGLPPQSETRLRRHLKECGRCRSYHDEQVVLLRVLGGDPATPTSREEERIVGQALRAAGLAPPDGAVAERRSLLERILYTPAPALAAITALVLVVFTLGFWFILKPSEPVFSARLLKGQNVTLDGVPADTRMFGEVPIREGEKLEVAGRGIAEISLLRGGTVRIFPRTVLSLSGQGEELGLDLGKVWCIVDASGIPFVVKTNVAEARVVGTSFVVEREKSGDTEVRVMKGEVDVRNVKEKKTVRVRGGSKTRVVPDKPPSPPRRYDPEDDESEWEAFLRELKLGIKRAIRDVKKFFQGK